MVVIPTTEGLPGEVVVVEWKAAGQPADAVAVHVEQFAAVVALFLEHDGVLARRNAEAVDGHGLATHPPHNPILKQGSKRFVEDFFLLGHGAGREQAGGIAPHTAGNAMDHPEKLPEFRLLVETALEIGDPLGADAVPRPVAALPE